MEGAWHQEGLSDDVEELELPVIDESAGAEIAYSAEIAHFYRPLDTTDREWMEQLGCQWGTGFGDGSLDESSRLEHLNELVIAGSALQSSHPDLYSQAVYKARQEFLSVFPRADRIHRAVATYTLSDRKRPPLPARFISIARFLYSYRINVGDYLARNQLSIYVGANEANERLRVLCDHGIHPDKFLATSIHKGNSILANATGTVARKLRVLHGIASVWGWSLAEANRVIEENSSLLQKNTYRSLILGRISVALFARRPVEDVTTNEISQHLISSVEASVAAYLDRGPALHSSKALVSCARNLMRYYTKAELRGYIATYLTDYINTCIAHHIDDYLEEHADADQDEASISLRPKAMRALDPVVRQYLRGYPIGREEAGQLPQVRDLSRHDATWMEDEPFDPSEKPHRTRVRASDQRQVENYLRRMGSEPGREELHSRLDTIRAGLRAPSLGPLTSEGQDAIERLAGAYSKKLLELRYPDSGRLVFPSGHEDARQTGMLKLTIAIIRLARRHDKDRPADTWKFLENQILNEISLGSDFFEKEDNDNDTDGRAPGSAPSQYQTESTGPSLQTPTGAAMISAAAAKQTLQKLKNAADRQKP